MDNQNESNKMNSTVSIPLAEYNELVRNNTLFHMILMNRSERSWDVAELVNMVYKTVFPSASVESGGDSDA